MQKIILLLALFLMVGCIPLPAQHRSTKSPNQICAERNHILIDSIEVTRPNIAFDYIDGVKIATRERIIEDQEDYSIIVIPSPTEMHYKCARCGETIIKKMPDLKRDTVWRRYEPNMDTMIMVTDPKIIDRLKRMSVGTYKK